MKNNQRTKVNERSTVIAQVTNLIYSFIMEILVAYKCMHGNKRVCAQRFCNTMRHVLTDTWHNAFLDFSQNLKLVYLETNLILCNSTVTICIFVNSHIVYMSRSVDASSRE